MNITIVIVEELNKKNSLFFVNFSAHTRLYVDFIRFYNLKNIDKDLLHSRELSIALEHRFFSKKNSITSIPRISIYLSYLS